MDILALLLVEPLKKAYLALVTAFKELVLTQSSLVQNNLTDYLYGNALGVYGYIAIGVAYVTLVIALFHHKARAKFVMSILILITVGLLGPMWFLGADEITKFGDSLTKAALQLGSMNADQTSAALPSLGSAETLIAIPVYGMTLVLGLWLYMMFISYSGIAILVKFFSLLILALCALGPRSQKVFNFIIAVGIVTMIIGKPVAMLCLSMGQAMVTLFGGEKASLLMTGGITIFAMFMALMVQPVLVILAYKSVSPIMGRVFANVEGRVKQIAERTSAPQKAILAAHIASLQGRARAVSAAQPNFGRRVATQARQAALAKTATVIAKKHPVGAAASVAIRAIPKGQPR